MTHKLSIPWRVNTNFYRIFNKPFQRLEVFLNLLGWGGILAQNVFLFSGRNMWKLAFRTNLLCLVL